MAKPAYPGLVLVPPSDRWIFRRRLVRWAILSIAVIWGGSAMNVWLLSSHNATDCQTDIDQGVSPDVQEGCDQQSQSVAEAPPHQSEFTVAESSPSADLAASHSPMPVPAQNTDRLGTSHNTSRTSMANPSSPARHPSDPLVASLQRDRSAPNQADKIPLPSLNPDTRLAEQGDAFAQYRLGRFYTQHGGPHAPESVSWYTKASDGLRRLAEDGNGEAMYVLGVMYAFGRGVKKDSEQARRWLTQAVDHQVPSARQVLASLEKPRTAAHDQQAFASH